MTQDAGTGVYSSSVISTCQSPSFSCSLMRRAAYCESGARFYPSFVARLTMPFAEVFVTLEEATRGEARADGETLWKRVSAGVLERATPTARWTDCVRPPTDS